MPLQTHTNYMPDATLAATNLFLLSSTGTRYIHFANTTPDMSHNRTPVHPAPSSGEEFLFHSTWLAGGANAASKLVSLRETITL